jgi:hypothetical protein
MPSLAGVDAAVVAAVWGESAKLPRPVIRSSSSRCCPVEAAGKTAASRDQEEQLEVLPGRRPLGVMPSLAGEDADVVAVIC